MPGFARSGKAVLSKATLGKPRQGNYISLLNGAWHGGAGRGPARPGQAKQGKPRI